MAIESAEKQNELVNRPNVDVTVDGDSYSTQTAYPDDLTHTVRIGAGYKNVQLPNNFAYDGGDEVQLTAVQFGQISPAAFAAGVVEDITA